MQSLFPTMLQENLIQRVRSILAERSEKLDKIKTGKQAREYCDNVRRKITRCFGPLPKKNPLNIRVISEKECDGFSRQNLLFESRPGYFVTGNLYIPSGKGKAPAILFCAGHSPEGKAAPIYQTCCQMLVKQGYLVFFPDPVSQGERWHYANDEFQAKLWSGKSSVNEHNVIGKSQRLVGDFLGTWRVWDKIRALDVLLSHPRADKSKVGITGTSGGGTLSCYVNALDSRPTMIAPSCYMTSYLYNLENSLPCDAEQMPPNMLAYGLDMIDLIIARAPRPTIILAQKYDFFDPRGAEEAYIQAKKIYRLLGAEENIQLKFGTEKHGYGVEHREWMYKFFKKYSGTTGPTSENKFQIKLASDSELFAAGGCVNTLGSKPVWKFTAEKAKVLKSAQPKYSKTEKLKKLKEALHLPARKKICHYRNSQIQILGPHDSDFKTATFMTQYLVETEPGILAVLNRFLMGDPNKCFRLDPPKELVLFMSDNQAIDEYNIEKHKIMGRKTTDAWILDVRGFGATQAKSLADYSLEHPYGMDYMLASTYDMLRESLLGLRVYDTLCTLDLLVKNGAKKITLVGKRNAAIVTTLAGALHPNVKKVELVNPVESFFELTQKPISSVLFSSVVPNFLKHFDWTDFL